MENVSRPNTYILKVGTTKIIPALSDFQTQALEYG